MRCGGGATVAAQLVGVGVGQCSRFMLDADLCVLMRADTVQVC